MQTLQTLQLHEMFVYHSRTSHAYEVSPNRRVNAFLRSSHGARQHQHMHPQPGSPVGVSPENRHMSICICRSAADLLTKKLQDLLSIYSASGRTWPPSPDLHIPSNT